MDFKRKVDGQDINGYYDNVVGVILPVENKMLPIVHLILKLTKNTPTFLHFLPKTQRLCFASC